MSDNDLDMCARQIHRFTKIVASPGASMCPERTDWLEDFSIEIAQSPRGRHDDKATHCRI